MINNKVYKAIGKIVIGRRKEMGDISKKDLSLRANVHYCTVDRIEEGDENYEINSLIKVIYALELSYEDFFAMLTYELNDSKTKIKTFKTNITFKETGDKSIELNFSIPEEMYKNKFTNIESKQNLNKDNVLYK